MLCRLPGRAFRLCHSHNKLAQMQPEKQYLMMQRIGNTRHQASMKDEYEEMDSSGSIYAVRNFQLESGVMLKEAQICYNTYGQLNDTRDNVLVVCHALTGNSRLDAWWGGLLGPGKAFDTDKYLVVCANVLASCYGSTGPQSLNPDTGEMYGNTFPDTTIRDSVRMQICMVKEALGAQGVACVIGGSMGGCQALEWAIMTSEEDVVGNASTITGNQSADYSNSNDNSNNSSTTTETCSGDSSDGSTSVSNVGTSGKKPFLRSAIVIGCGECHSGWQIGFQEAQRQAIYADPKWNNGDVDMNDPPISGLAVARQIGMISYRTHGAFTKKFGREIDEKSDKYQVRRYLEYQGHKFLSRFDPVSYLKLTEQLDSHDVGRSRGGADKALASILQRILVIGISSDILYPLIEQKELCEKISGSEMRVVNSSDGHDGFLLEQDQVGGHIQEFLDSLES